MCTRPLRAFAHCVHAFTHARVHLLARSFVPSFHKHSLSASGELPALLTPPAPQVRARRAESQRISMWVAQKRGTQRLGGLVAVSGREAPSCCHNQLAVQSQMGSGGWVNVMAAPPLPPAWVWHSPPA